MIRVDYASVEEYIKTKNNEDKTAQTSSRTLADYDEFKKWINDNHTHYYKILEFYLKSINFEENFEKNFRGPDSEKCCIKLNSYHSNIKILNKFLQLFYDDSNFEKLENYLHNTYIGTPLTNHNDMKKVKKHNPCIRNTKNNILTIYFYLCESISSL